MSSPVEQIKQRLTVVDVVGSYIKLKKAGANYRAVCPFHSEKDASFYVSPSREIWHCFGCNRGGDMFEFVKQIEGVEFPDALRILADRAGVSVTYQNPEIRNEKTQLLDLLKDASVFYQKNLALNRNVLSYLWKRGLKNESLKKFSIGFAPTEDAGWRNLFDFLKSKGYSNEQMKKAGLVVSKEGSGDCYDRFRGRIMFPLKDASGRVVGFSGRIFGKEKEGIGKYINTPQTVVYNKSKILYGFDAAKTEIRKKDACILVEGQMDVLMAHQIGCVNTVAVSGTALTDHHLNLIRRLSGNLIMAFDSDEAGFSAAKRSIDLAFSNGFEVRAILMPQGKDPADVILEDGSGWLRLAEDANHVIDFYLNILKQKHDSWDSRGFKIDVEKNVLPYIASIQSEIDKNYWVSKIANTINVREEAVFKQIEKLDSSIIRKETPFNTAQGGKQKKDEPFCSAPLRSRKDLLKDRLLGLALWRGWDIDSAHYSGEIKKLIFSGHEAGLPAGQAGEKEYLNRIIFEAELCYQNNDNLDEEIENLTREFKKEYLKEKLNILAEDIRKCENCGKKEELQNKLTDFQKLTRQLAALCL